MSGEAQGPNIAEWQAQQQHQEHQEGKSGFGLGYSDSVATIVDGMKWLFSFHEGAITSYSNVFEGLVNGSSLVTLFGKSGNMFGIKFLEDLAEHFSGENRDSESITLEGMDIGYSDKCLPYPGDYPNFSNEIVHGESLHDIYNLGNHCDPSFSPSPSPFVGDDYEHELDA
ncbi:hypothetical protein [Wolbachia endosymbiont of Dirofilaria (Dirofilaria) immitis]|uniref:hypothetical protein n=1 Tax=Wolbachia endosymbiont of Dirofilaria (Dirofilaria) immitis TaxID=1812115 RepID=UPI00158B907B|nr:hypothetical protein [Wolbachia endosymbiont of Dirofilaria (Dirofilaria) immitis]QKX02301.1 hypothetical protein GOY12_01855 [Wolbachia endosymbiont of Dirofilaria (Dirofilaria) immitis]